MGTAAVSSSPSLTSTASPVVCAGLVVADHLCPPLDHLPRAGELIAVDELVLNIGGGAANTAVDLARLGVHGGDLRPRRRRHLRPVRHRDASWLTGSTRRALKIDPRLATSQTLIVNVRGQDRRFIHSVGANTGFVAADLDAVLEQPPRVLHIGYFLILPNLDAAALAERFARARRAGTVTLLDVATPGPGNYLEPLKVVLPHTDVFVPNTDEAELILGGETDPVRQALTFHELGARRVVITRGEHGVVSVSDGLRVKLGTYPISFVDGSGGGDAFNAGYIVGLLEGRSELECLKLASAVGASCVRSVGTTAGVFTRAEAEDFVHKHQITVEPIG